MKFLLQTLISKIHPPGSCQNMSNYLIDAKSHTKLLFLNSNSQQRTTIIYEFC